MRFASSALRSNRLHEQFRGLLCGTTFSVVGALAAPPSAKAISAPPPSLSGELKIATYNVENYGSINRHTPHGFRSDYPKSERSKQALRQVIREIDADVIVLQEVGEDNYLLEFQRDLKFEGLSYPYTALMHGPDKARHLAALARIPFTAVHEHSPLRFGYLGDHEDVKRGLLELRVETPVGPLALWAVHLKSRLIENKADPESAIRRSGEAMRIREFILQRIADTGTPHYLILGDFNDSKASVPLRYLMRRGNLTISELLPASDSRGEHWTYHNARDDSYWRIDHILVSPSLLPAVKRGTAQIADGPHSLEASDHRPVSVALDFSAISVLSARLQPPTDTPSPPPED